MKLKTSFFNTTVFRKDITRFAPVWGGYSVFLLLCAMLLGQFSLESFPGRFYYCTWAVSLILYPYCILCAVMLFGDLYSRSRCNALHAMPVRREAWFVTHSLAGFLFFLIPTLLFGVWTAVSSGGQWFAAGEFVLKEILQFVFRFGMALLCVMLAGNRTGAVCLYIIIHALEMVFGWMFQQMYAPYLLSLAIPDNRFSNTYFLDLLLFLHEKTVLQLLLYGAVGAVAAVAAFWLYRRRKLEYSGKFLVVQGLEYVFTVIFSLVASVITFNLAEHAAEDFYLLLPYLVVFFFAARMLMQRRFHVFQMQSVVILLAVIFVFLGSLWLTRVDALGVVSYVPETEDIKSVSVYVDVTKTARSTYYDYDRFSEEGFLVSAPEDIDAVTQVHAQLTEGEEFDGVCEEVYFTYTLKNGIRIRRHYSLSYLNPARENLDLAISSRQTLFGDVDWDTYVNEVYYIKVSRARGGSRSFLFAEPAITENETATIKIHNDSMRLEMMEWLKKGIDGGYVRQLGFDQWNVVIKSRDSRGKEKEVRMIAYSCGYVERCWDYARNLPDRTITEDMQID